LDIKLKRPDILGEEELFDPGFDGSVGAFGADLLLLEQSYHSGESS
jgi:hypothetical protein